ncbi:hypothetical protein D3C72_2289830 [compost metagenome]
MGHKPFAAVHHLCRLCSAFLQPADKIEQREVTFSQIRCFSRPVVHLRVNVDRIFAVPDRQHMLIPDALQVGRQRAGPAACD